MDAHIRNLLSSAEKGKNVRENLGRALELLKQPATTSGDGSELFPQDLYVLFAELAVKHGAKTAAADMLKQFLSKSPPPNQFLCRAYLCQAQLIAPASSDQFEEFEKSVSYLLKAISFAKENPRYHFLVYNASVLYWNFCRAFLKPFSKQHLTKSMQQVVKALDDIDDQDFEWRATLQIALVQCHLDGNRVSEASTAASHALSFIRHNFPNKFKELFGIVIKNNLIDPQKLVKDMKHSPELTIYYRLCKLKNAIDTRDSSVNLIEEVQKILKVVVQGELPDLSDPTAPTSGKKGKRPVTPTNREDSTADGKTSDQPNAKSTTSLDLEKSPVKTKRTAPNVPQIPAMKKLNIDCADKPYLLLDLARIGLEMSLTQVVALCVEQMRTNCVIKDKGFFMEVEFIDAMLTVKMLEDDPFSNHSVRTRQNAIMKCEEAVLNAVRHGDPKIIQVGCITLWNMALPLLQKNLRKNLRKPLQVIATALEEIKSLLMVLRCQIHLELGKCEEDVEQIEVALQNYKKALSLDDTGIYRERLEMAINRVELRATLYDNPERPEDVATMIIEQAQASDSGSIRMKRSLLIKVGLALAPDVFDIALDSENEAKATINSDKTQEGMIKQMNARAQQYIKCIAKVPGHLERLGAENDLERAFLWADLAKIARKQQVWDVCRVACRFCLLYDDERFRLKSSSLKSTRSKNASRNDDNEVDKKSRPSSPAVNQQQGPSLLETDTLRMISEIHFINAEALIHLLRTEGVELNDEPVAPQDISKRPKGYIPKKTDEMADWIAYRDWIKDLNSEVVNSFLRAVAIGKELKETWIVVNAATYYWNYNNHMISQGKHRDIHEQLQIILDGLKKAGHEGATTLLVNICVALAQGYIQPWLPEKQAKQPILPKGREKDDDDDDDDVHAQVKSPKGKKMPANVAAAKARIPEVSIGPDAAPDAKRALEVIEYAMKVTNGSQPSDIVALNVRYPMLQMWVLIKQMLQQQISKHLGTDDESLNEAQNPMTRAQVAVEMLCLSTNGIFEFKEGPTLEEATTMTEGCEWSDSLIELQLWSRLAAFARFVKDHAITMKCSQKAVSFASEVVASPPPKTSNTRTPGTAAPPVMLNERYVTQQRMIAYASCMRGETLIENLRGQTSLRHEAIHNFLQSAQFGKNAMSYDLVLAAARNYWNAVLPLIGSPYERQLLKESLKTILECLAYTMDKNIMKAREESERLQKTEAEEIVSGGSAPNLPAVLEAGEPNPPKKELDASEDDLALQAAMYGVLFQVYADNCDWQEGLKLMDVAISSMPRTKHRLLLFKHRVMVKAKLGHNVSLDIQKFRNESEQQFSQMWHKLALFSKESADQLSCYQNAIEALMKVDSVYQRVDYLMEYAQWLKVNDFPLQDTLDILDWASDLLLNMKTQSESRPVTKGDKRKGKTELGTTKKPKKDAKADDSKKAKGDKKDDKKDDKKAKDVKGYKDGKASAAKKLSASKPQEKSDLETPKKEEKKKSAAKKEENQDPDALDINEEDYIPINKKAEIGMVVDAEDLKITDLVDMKQLDYLLRLSILAAQVSGQGCSEYFNYIFSAYGYVSRMWQLLLGTIAPTLKEINKQAAAAAEAGKGSGKKKGKGDKGDAPTKERQKRKGPLDHMPVTAEDWSTYDAPDEVVDAASHALMKLAAINTNTITKPTLLLLSLETLNDQLRATGYNHLCLPTLAFQDLLTRSLCKSQAYNILIHLRCLEVCTELDLQDGAKFHEKLVNQIVPVDLDLASSWIEMAIFKEKQFQVEQEEKRIQDSLKALLEDEKIGADGMLPTKLSRPKGEDTETEAPHLGQMVSSIKLRDVWTSTAHILIRLGYNQPARQYLYAALQSSQEFDDTIQQSKILSLLGELSFKENQYQQCINYLMESQKAIGTTDEYYWYKTHLLIAKCQAMDESVKNHKSKAASTCLDSLKMFQAVFSRRPNELSSQPYITAMLEAKHAEIRASMHLEHSKVLLKPRYLQTTTNTLDKWFDAAVKLQDANYNREAAKNFKDIGLIWSSIAEQAFEDLPLKHDLLIKAYTTLNKAYEIADEQRYMATSSLIPADLAKVSLPVQREYIEIQLSLVKCLLQIFETYIEEKKTKHELEKTKDHIQKVVESVVRTTPVYTESEMNWMEMTQKVAQVIISLVTSSFHMCSGLPMLSAESLLCGGKCLRLLALYTNMDSPDSWKVDSQIVVKLIQTMTTALEDVPEVPEEDEVETQELDRETKDFQRNAAEIDEVVEKELESVSLNAQASELLGQALQICLNHDIIPTARLVAYEMVELFSQFDAAFSAQYLALYQSCSASIELRKLMKACYKDPVASRKAAMLNLYEQLEKDNVTTNLTSSQLYKQVKALLAESEAWKSLQISPNHLDLMRDLPGNWQLVVLQHSPCRHYLYGAVLDKPEASGKKPDKSKPTIGLHPSKAKIEKIPVTSANMDSMIEAMRDHKFEVMTTLLKQEYQRTIVKQQERMLESMGEEAQPLDDLTLEEDEAELQGQFDKIYEGLEAYVEPLTGLLDVDARPGTSSTMNLEPKKDKNPPPEVQDTTVLLADCLLMELPLESLEMFAHDSILSMSRDVSLQMIYNRYHQEQLTPEEIKAKQSAKNAIPPRIPGARDANKKQAKYIPLDRPIPANCTPVDTNNMKFMVDPHGDLVEDDDDSPMKIFDTLFNRYNQQFTTRWLGITYQDHEPSVAEWETYLSDSSGFLFYGFEHLLSYISPDKLVSLDLPECMICMLCDLSQTSKSFTRRSVSNVLKRPSELLLETSLCTSLMLSLTGIKCVISNQWHCTLADNSSNISNVMKDLLEKGKTSGYAGRLLCHPKQREAIEQAEKEELERLQREKELANQKGAESKPADENVNELTTEEPEKPGPEPELEPEEEQKKLRRFYNMVTYGLPNLMVTQM